MFEDIENNTYFINDQAGVAFALTEYGWCGYDSEWGEFSKGLSEDIQRQLFTEGGVPKGGSRRVSYNEAKAFAKGKGKAAAPQQ